MRIRVLVLCLAALALAAAPALAQDSKASQRQSKPKAKPAKPKKEETEKPAPVSSATIRAAYAALPVAERYAIQSDLIWSGDYDGGISGEFNDRAVAAVKAFQKRNKAQETGILAPQERAALASAVREQQEQVGWTLVEDPMMTGVRIGIPAKLAPKASRGKTGGRWTSARGEVQIETFRDSIADTSLSALFEQQKKTPAERKIEHSALKTDSFVVSGMQGLKNFYVRAELKDSEVRGLTILYDQAMEGIMRPVVSAMASAFAPFAGDAAMIGVKRNVEYATAVVATGAGHLVADSAATDGCLSIAVPGLGNAARIAEDKEADLALLRVYGARGLQPLTLSTQPPRSNELTLIGVADPKTQNGKNEATAVGVHIRGSEDGRVLLEPAPPLGFSGAAAIDRQGHFVGLAGLKPSVVAGPPAPPQAALTSAAAVTRLLIANGAEFATGAVTAEAAAASVKRIICVRK